MPLKLQEKQNDRGPSQTSDLAAGKREQGASSKFALGASFKCVCPKFLNCGEQIVLFLLQQLFSDSIKYSLAAVVMRVITTAGVRYY